MSIGILNTALSGLAAFQRSLETTSNNISNVNTEGYSRQRAELATRPEQYTSGGYLGTGVNVVNITRSYDQFLTSQVRASTSAFSEVDSYHSLASQIDKLLADEATGLSSSMKSFFNAVNDVANDPSSVPIRNVLISETNALTNQFSTMGSRLDEIKQQVDSNLETGVDDLNNYAAAIAKLNVQIVDYIGRGNGQQMPNDLLDQRDELLRKVSEKIDTSVVSQSDGSVSVFIGQGQPLVLGPTASTFSLTGNTFDPTQMEIKLNGQNITDYFSGGQIGGNLRFRDEVLYPAQRQLGLLAIGIATEFNNIHKSGYDLDGETDLAFFDLGKPPVQVLGNSSVSGLEVKAEFLDPTSSANLGTSYRIDVTATGDFDITNLSNNKPVGTFTLADLQAGTPDLGFTFDILGGPANPGDQFEVSPSIDAARYLSLSNDIASPRNIAAAQGFVAGPPVSGLPGDNRNALDLAKLETATLMQNGKITFTQVYGQLVTEVGGKTNTALVSRSAQDVLLENATTAKENLSGVNLDEEAANLIKFQNSYQAAAKAVSVANSLFDTLIGAVR